LIVIKAHRIIASKIRSEDLISRKLRGLEKELA